MLDKLRRYGSAGARKHGAMQQCGAQSLQFCSRDGNGGSREGHVIKLGHDMSPDRDPKQVAVLVDEVHAYSAR